MKSETNQDFVEQILSNMLKVLDGTKSFDNAELSTLADSKLSEEDFLAGAMMVLVEWAIVRVTSGTGSLEDGLREILSKERTAGDLRETVIYDMLKIKGMPPPGILAGLERIVIEVGKRSKRHLSN